MGTRYKPGQRNVVYSGRPTLVHEIGSDGLVSTPDDTLERIQKEVSKELARKEYPFPVGHRASAERARAWSILSNQVVGHEDIETLR